MLKFESNTFLFKLLSQEWKNNIHILFIKTYKLFKKFKIKLDNILSFPILTCVFFYVWISMDWIFKYEESFVPVEGLSC